MILNVLYQSSSEYSRIAATSICSLLDTNKKMSEINVYYIDAGLTSNDKQIIKSIVEHYGRNIVFLETSRINEMLERQGVQLWKGSYATFFKLFVIDELEVDTILYIDADTIIKESLENLSFFDFGGKPIGLVNSAISNTVKKFYDVKEWYNAGVIYFDVAKWKEKELEKTILNSITGSEYKKLSLIGDESLINVVLKAYIIKMDLIYNYESSWWLWGWNKKLYSQLGFENDKYVNYSIKEIRHANKHAKIVHYTALTTGRPWDKYNDNRARKDFKKYYRKCGYKDGIDLYKGKSNKKSDTELFFMRLKRKMMPMWYRSVYGFRLHDETWKKAIDASIKEERR